MIEITQKEFQEKVKQKQVDHQAAGGYISKGEAESMLNEVYKVEGGCNK